MSQKSFTLCMLAAGMMVFASTARADDSSTGSTSTPTSFSLQSAAPQAEEANDAGGGAAASWDVEGPVSMRSADVQEAGTFDLKIIFDYGTSSDGSDDDIGNRVELQWGIMEGHEIVLKLPVSYGDGRIDGNGDLSVGWQWKFLEGDGGWMPAMAVYNELRTPTGYHSEGVDWEFRGVFTWDVNPGTCRLHLNPFIRFMDTGNLETNLSRADRDDDLGFLFTDDDQVSGRHFAAGGVIGVDHRLTDSTVINLDYILDSGRLDGYSMQHSMEAGMDYQIADNQTLTWSTRWTMDGDDQGDNWGFSLGYNFTF